MAALVREEEADRERQERQKAKKVAKKQKQAAKKQQQEEEQRKVAAEQEKEEEEQRAQRQLAEKACEPSVAASRSGRVAPLAEQQPRQQQQQQLQASPVSKVAAPGAGRLASDQAPAAAVLPLRVLPASNAAQTPGASPKRSVAVAVAPKPSPQGPAKQGRSAACQPASPAPLIVAATRNSLVSGAVSRPLSVGVVPAASQLPQQGQAMPAPLAAAALPGQPGTSKPAVEVHAPHSGGLQATRLAPWAGVAAARASAVQLQQQQQDASPAPQQAPGITRPAHISSTLSAASSRQLQHPLAAATPSAGLPPRLGAWPASAAPPLHRPPATQPAGGAEAAQAPPGSLAPALATSGYLPGPAVHQQQHLQQHQQQQQAPMVTAPPAVLPAPGVSGGNAQAAQQPASEFQRPALASLATGQGQRQQPHQHVMQPASPAGPSAGFVPLFGLNLPNLQGMLAGWLATCAVRPMQAACLLPSGARSGSAACRHVCVLATPAHACHIAVNPPTALPAKQVWVWTGACRALPPSLPLAARPDAQWCTSLLRPSPHTLRLPQWQRWAASHPAMRAALSLRLMICCTACTAAMSAGHWRRPAQRRPRELHHMRPRVMPPLPPWWAMLMVSTMCCGCSLGSLNEALMACAGGRSFELRLQKFES